MHTTHTVSKFVQLRCYIPLRQTGNGRRPKLLLSGTLRAMTGGTQTEQCLATVIVTPGWLTPGYAQHPQQAHHRKEHVISFADPRSLGVPGIGSVPPLDKGG
jgi:hypothetical protein